MAPAPLRFDRAAGAALLALVALLAARRGRAEEPRGRTSSLSWIRLPGAEDCVATQALARAVEERLARAVFVSAAQADVSVEGRIEPRPRKDGGGWRASITVRGASGELLGTREVERADASCSAMTAPLALVVATMIDPLTPPPGKRGDETAEKPGGKPAEKPAPDVVVQKERVFVPVPVEVRVPVPAPPPPPAVRVEGAASLFGSAGLTPGPALGVGATSLLYLRGFVPLAASGSFWLDSTADAPAGGRTAFSLFLVGGAFCPLWHDSPRAHLYLCAGGHLGALRARSSGYVSAAPDATRVVWNGALEGRATLVAVKPFAVRAGAALVVPLLRDSFVYDRPGGGQAELFRMSPVAGLVDLGLGVDVP